MNRCRYFLWNTFTNRFPLAQIALIFVLLSLFLELMLKTDRKPETLTK